MFQKLKLAKALLVVGYTGMAAVLVSVFVYVLQISAQPAMATLPLTLTFLCLNLMAWWLGYEAGKNPATARFNTAPWLLGDALLLLNLQTLFFLYVPLLKGQLYASLSVTLLVGVVYHLGIYLRPQPHLPAPCYSYFFTFAGGALFYLTQWTLGQQRNWAIWFVIGFGLALYVSVLAWSLPARAHFSLALMLLLATLVGLSARDFLAQPTLELLLALLAVTALFFAMAWTARALGPLCRALGFGAYCAFTLTCTATLYYLAVPAYVYVLATMAWLVVLTLLVLALTDEGSEPFAQPAYWVSALLGLGLLVYWQPFWVLLGKLHFSLPVRHALALPLYTQLAQPVEWLTLLTLAVVSGAFLVSGFWKRRYPAITFSLWGYAVNYALVIITSGLPLLLLAATGSGLWLIYGQAAYGLWLAPFALGTVYFALSQWQDSLYPVAMLKVAGYLTLCVAALTAFYQAELAVFVLLAAALVFLWRSAVEQSFVAQLLFLSTTTGAAALAAFRVFGEARLVLMSALTVGLLVVYRWQAARRQMSVASRRLTLIWAILLATAGGGFETIWGHFSPPVYFLIWFGFLLVPGASAASDTTAREQDHWPRLLGYWLGHAAGAVFIYALLRWLELPVAAAGPAIAGWAWLHLGVARLWVPGPRRAVARALTHAVHGFAVLAVVLAAGAAYPSLLAVCLLSNVILYFQLAHTLAGKAQSLPLSTPATDPATGPHPAPGEVFRRRVKMLRGAAYGWTLAAACVAAAQGALALIWVCAVAALVFFWRSVREQARLAHACFLGLTTVAALAAAFGLLSEQRLMLVSLLAVELLLAYRWLLTGQGAYSERRRFAERWRYAERRLTLQWAIALAVAATLGEAVWGTQSAAVYLPVWLGFLLGLKGRPGWDSAAAGTPQDQRLRWLGYGVAHAAGALALLAAVKQAGWPAAVGSLALAGWAWLHFDIAQTLAARAVSPVVLATTRQAVHGLALAVLVLAPFSLAVGPFSILAVFLIGVLYLALRAAWSQKVLEDLAVLAFIEAFTLLGVKWRIVLPDYYLSLVGLYLCFVLYRQMKHKAQPYTAAAARPAAERDNRLAVALIGLLVAYPCAAVLWTLQDLHIFFLGSATVLLLYLFTKGRQHPLFVYLIGFLFVVGSAWLLAFGSPSQAAKLFLSLVGTLVTANQLFVALPAPKRLSS